MVPSEEYRLAEKRLDRATIVEPTSASHLNFEDVINQSFVDEQGSDEIYFSIDHKKCIY